MSRSFDRRRVHLLLTSALVLPVWLASRAPEAVTAPGADEPPVCIIDAPLEILCQGTTTGVLLDASASHDPEDAPLTFSWTSGCPGTGFDDPSSPSPMLFVDTAQSCDMGCWVRLRISDGRRSTFCRFFVRIVSARTLAMDIKPGSCPNPIKVGSGGVIPVSLLGSEDFDPTEVDLSTLALQRADGLGGSVAPTWQTSIADTGTPYDGELCDCHDLGGDGILDLSLKFDKQEVVTTLQLDAGLAGFVRLKLTGSLLSGDAFVAEDCVRVIL